MIDEKRLTGYELSREWFDFCFENPEKINPNHSAMFFFCIEHCNRLGWKNRFGLPTTMAMEALGIKSYNTYVKTFNDLADFGFIQILQRSKNQYSSNIIALSKNNKALDKALDKAMQKHATKRRRKQSESTGESKVSIDKLLTINNKHKTDLSFCDENFTSIVSDWLDYKKQRNESYKSQKALEALYRNLKKISNNNSETARQIIEKSMANNWAGLFKLENQTSQPAQHTGTLTKSSLKKF